MTLEVRLAPASNSFEIANGDQLAVSGKIFVPEEPLTMEDQTKQKPVNRDEGAVELSTKDAYKELRLRGYEYGGLFQGIVKAKNDGKKYIMTLLNWSVSSNVQHPKLSPNLCRGVTNFFGHFVGRASNK